MMGFAYKKGAWRGKMLVQLMIRSWQCAVAGWAGQRAKGVSPLPAPSMLNVQTFLYPTVCWATAHKYTQPFCVMSHLPRWKWRQMSERDEQCLNWPFCKSWSTLSLCHDRKKKKRFIKYIILPLHKKDVLCTQWPLVYLSFICCLWTQMPISTHIVIRNINIEFFMETLAWLMMEIWNKRLWSALTAAC